MNKSTNTVKTLIHSEDLFCHTVSAKKLPTELTQALEETADCDINKVAAIKTKIENNTYIIHRHQVEKIAELLLQTEIYTA